MKEHGCESIAFELLGPPRLSKLLYETHLLRKVCGTMENVVRTDADKLAEDTESLIVKDPNLRASILSIGIPILMKDGSRLLRGPEMKIPAYRGEDRFDVTADSIDTWAKEGWVDLRPSNMEIWKRRMAAIFDEMESIPKADTSSQYERDRNYWLEDGEINPGKVAGWIFANEEHGLRMKN